MKKIAYILIFSLLVVGLAACSPTTPKTPNASEITYTEEFDYIPKHDAMVLQDFAEAEEVGGFSDALYKLEGEAVKFDTFLEEYQALLVKDRWEITEDKKPISISARKGERSAVFLLSESNEGILMMVLTK